MLTIIHIIHPPNPTHFGSPSRTIKPPPKQQKVSNEKKLVISPCVFVEKTNKTSNPLSRWLFGCEFQMVKWLLLLHTGVYIRLYHAYFEPKWRRFSPG